MRFRTIISTVASAAIVVGLTGAPIAATASTGDTVTASEAVAALNATDAQNGNLIAEPAPSHSDADSAAVITTGQGSVDVSKDPGGGVDLTTPDGSKDSTVNVGLPNGNNDSGGKKVSDGAVVYTSSDGTANAVIPNSNGVQMLTVIASSDAPTSFTYPISIPSGGTVQLFNGGAVVQDANGNDILTVPPAWARDANGISVPTHFETDGTSLTQVVDHANGKYQYPIVADPSLWKIAKCTAAVAWLVGSTALGFKAIQALGGVAMAARLLVMAGGVTDWMKAVTGAASWVLGIQAIHDSCFR